MGRKPQRHTWPQAKKLCRLNQLDIEMAKRLGFGPDALIRAIPSPQQRWKLAVKDWLHELYCKRFGKALGAPADSPASDQRSPEPLESGRLGNSATAKHCSNSNFTPMSFVPIKLRDYVRKHLHDNPGSDERGMTARLRETLAAYQAGARCCVCGEPIWVIGSAELGNFCFTCATGEAEPSGDYEIAEACHKRSVSHALPEPDSGPDAASFDTGPDDRDVPF